MDPANDAVLVERVRSGDATAFAPLFERWYDRAYNVARGVVRRPEMAADVTQDAFLTAWQQLDRLDDVNAFGGWLLRITRNGGLDALRREGRSSATDDETVTALRDRGLPSPVAAGAVTGPAETAERHEREELLWAAAAALGERDASILDLHLRHGLTPGELADDLGVTAGHAQQLMHRLRTRLGDAIGAFLLWNRGAPHCSTLAGRTGSTFDAAAVTMIRRHTRSCDTCRDDQRRHTDPAKLFAAVPFALAPLAFRSRAAFALERAGAPMPPELTSPTSRGPGSRRTKRDGDDPGPDDGDRPQVDEPPPGRPLETLAAPRPDQRAPAPRRRQFATLAAVATIIVAGSTLILLAMTRDGDSSLRSASISIASTTSAPTTTTIPATTTTATTTTTTTTTTTIPEATTVAEPPVIAEPPAPEPPAAEPPPPEAPVPQPPAPQPPPADPAPPAGPTPPADPAPPRKPDPPVDPDQTVGPISPPDSTDSPPAPPVIMRFTLTQGRLLCVLPTLPVTARWLAEDADSATLEWAGQRAADLPATGTHEICLEPGTTITVTATNAGGNATASARW